MYELLIDATVNLLQLRYLVPLIAGVVTGVIGGALPGVTITMTIIVVLPFTFALDPLQGLAAMTGVYVGGSAGGLVTATLLGIPGTPSSVATTFDGHPMAREGQPGRALWLGIWASCFGGLIAGVFLIAATGPLARFAIEFGPWEYFALFILALSVVAGLVGDSLLKGLIAGVLGLVVTVLGADPMLGVPRLSFGIDFIEGGIPFLPVLIGVFAFTQIMGDVERFGRRGIGHARHDPGPELSVSRLATLWEVVSRPFVLAWSSLVGVVIGVLPAVGGSAANMLAWDQARKFSRQPERFGKGAPEGIIASESANNANVGGSLVTIMAFGIPGDAVTAVMLGALTIHGIQSGPLFISQNTELAYGIFAAYLLAHPLMVITLALMARPMLKVVSVPKPVLFPMVLMLAAIGAYALSNTMDGVYILACFGVLGYLMQRLGFPLAPFILGVILGDSIESNLIRAITTDPDLWKFATRPISGGLLALSFLSVGFAIWQRQHRKRVVGPGSGSADF
jgi:putative tricarboxylic transport membrane protein